MAELSPKHTQQHMEVNKVEHVDHPDSIDGEKQRSKHDSDSDSINEAALGDDLPPGYFYSIRFIGTLAVREHQKSQSSRVQLIGIRASVSRPSVPTFSSSYQPTS